MKVVWRVIKVKQMSDTGESKISGNQNQMTSSINIDTH